MNIYLIAEKLSHSYSKLIHNKLYKYNYELKEIDSGDLGNFLTTKDFDGLNVTIPYKTVIIPYLDNLSAEAKKLNSVNTVVNKNGVLTGYNTDYYGFMYLVNKYNIDFNNKKVLIIGNGGASKTIQACVDTYNIKEKIVVDRKNNNEKFLANHYNSDIIINTTPVGMYPNNGTSPIDLSRFTKISAVIDIIYNPFKTKLLIDASNRNIKTANGLTMLVAQAKKACEIFTNKSIPDTVIDKIVSEIELETKNITLIGMPGSGKTTIGKILAKKLNRTYYDTDDEITATGINIPMFLSNYSEQEFRIIENKVSSKILSKSSCVISTGGGIITYPPNLDILVQNSIIFYINRDVNLLATKDRPLSAGGKEQLYKLYKERFDKYLFACDYEIVNDTTPEKAAQKIIDIIKMRLNDEIIDN